MLISIPSAYVFARKRFRFRESFFYAIAGTLVFPYILLLIPITSFWIRAGLHNTFTGLWIAYQVFAVPYCLWLLRGAFAKLPPHLEEAAMVYGCTQFQAFYRVVLPLVKPIIVAVLFLTFIYGWSDYLFSNMLSIDDNGPVTANVMLFNTVRGGELIQWELMMVATIITGVPPVIIYFFAQKYISRTFAGAVN